MLRSPALPFRRLMKPTYDAYYRAIPNLGREEDASPSPHPRPARRKIAPAVPLRQASALEALHPEIVQAITLLWGYPEMDVYFEKLWLDDGNGSPIAPEAMSELMLLAGVGAAKPAPAARRLVANLVTARRPRLWQNPHLGGMGVPPGGIRAGPPDGPCRSHRGGCARCLGGRTKRHSGGLLALVPAGLQAVADYELGPGAGVPLERASAAIDQAAQFIDRVATLLA